MIKPCKKTEKMASKVYHEFFEYYFMKTNNHIDKGLGISKKVGNGSISTFKCTSETNELDEILAEVQSKLAYDSKEILEVAKQQINKWALEKCLKVIGEKKPTDKLISSYRQVVNAENNLIEIQIERARKEFYE